MSRKFKKIIFIVVFIVLLLFANKINVFGVDEQVNNTVEEEQEEKKDEDTKNNNEEEEKEQEKVTTINLKYDKNTRMYQNNVKYYQIQDSIKITGGDYELSTSSIGLKVLKVNQKLLGKTSRILYKEN